MQICQYYNVIIAQKKHVMVSLLITFTQKKLNTHYTDDNLTFKKDIQIFNEVKNPEHLIVHNYMDLSIVTLIIIMIVLLTTST